MLTRCSLPARRSLAASGRAGCQSGENENLFSKQKHFTHYSASSSTLRSVLSGVTTKKIKFINKTKFIAFVVRAAASFQLALLCLN